MAMSNPSGSEISRERVVAPGIRRDKLAKQRQFLVQKRRQRKASGGMIRMHQADLSPEPRPLDRPSALSVNSANKAGVKSIELVSPSLSAPKQPPPVETPAVARERAMRVQGITPIFDPNANSSQDKDDSSKRGPSINSPARLDSTNTREFIHTPAPKDRTLQCTIRRSKAGITKMYAQYELILDGGIFLMAARKRARNKTSNYMICTSRLDMDRMSDHFVGKLRANFVGTEFVAYDDGVNPDREGASRVDENDENRHSKVVTGGSSTSMKMRRDSKNDEDSPRSRSLLPRKELCAVLYQSNILGSRGPRKMTVVLPRMLPSGSVADCAPSSSAAGDGLVARFREERQQLVVSMLNKSPKWNEQVGAYVLNFNGRVTMASVKNFQLVLPEDPDEKPVLQFGRIGKDEFTMDIRYPLSPFQAFAVCLSSFDHKLACE